MKHLQFKSNESETSIRILTALLCIAALVYLNVGCSTTQLSSAETAVVTDAPAFINALSSAGVFGPKGTADAEAAGWALQLLATKQTGTSITAADLTTGIPKIDGVIQANVSPGVLTSTGAGKLLTVADALINTTTSP